MNTCPVCQQPLGVGEAIICQQCAAPDTVSLDDKVLARCVGCQAPTRGTYGGEFPVCLPCYATGNLTEEQIAMYGCHPEAQ